MAWAGKTIGTMSSLWPKTDKFFEPFTMQSFNGHLLGKKIGGVERCGKWLAVTNDQQTVEFAFHLGSTGWLLPIANAEPIPDSFPHKNFLHKVNFKALRFSMNLGDTVWGYYDGRTWGQFLIPDDGESPWAKYGPDWITEDQTAAHKLGLYETKSAKTVKQVLCDQEITAGLGNYLSCEAVHRAKIRPNRLWKELDSGEIIRLRGAIKVVVSYAMSYDNHDWWRVFKREGESCLTCKAANIEYEKDPGGARGSYFCPNCQA